MLQLNVSTATSLENYEKQFWVSCIYILMFPVYIFSFHLTKVWLCDMPGKRFNTKEFADYYLHPSYLLYVVSLLL